MVHVPLSPILYPADKLSSSPLIGCQFMSDDVLDFSMIIWRGRGRNELLSRLNIYFGEGIWLCDALVDNAIHACCCCWWWLDMKLRPAPIFTYSPNHYCWCSAIKYTYLTTSVHRHLPSTPPLPSVWINDGLRHCFPFASYIIVYPASLRGNPQTSSVIKANALLVWTRPW